MDNVFCWPEKKMLTVQDSMVLVKSPGILSKP